MRGRPSCPLLDQPVLHLALTLSNASLVPSRIKFGVHNLGFWMTKVKPILTVAILVGRLLRLRCRTTKLIAIFKDSMYHLPSAIVLGLNKWMIWKVLCQVTALCPELGASQRWAYRTTEDFRGDYRIAKFGSGPPYCYRWSFRDYFYY